MEDEEGRREMTKKQSSRFKSICVFCGSSNGKKASYQDAAIDLGKELVNNTSLLESYSPSVFQFSTI